MKFSRLEILIAVIVTSAAFAVGFKFERTHEDERLSRLVQVSRQAEQDFRDLIFAYELRLDTIRSLVELANRRGLNVHQKLVAALNDLNARPNLSNVHEIDVYVDNQSGLDTMTKDLIERMDAEIPPADEIFQKLFREFLNKERSLAEIRNRFAEQSERIRQLARKGDRKFFSPGVLLVSNAEQSI